MDRVGAAPFISIAVVDDLQGQHSAAMRVGAQLARTAGLPVEVLAVDHDAQNVAEDASALSEQIAHRHGLLPVLTASVWRSHRAVLLDDVAETIIEHVLAPVLVVGPNASGWSGGRPIPVLAVDGSDIAAAAVPVVAAWACAFSRGAASVVEVVPPLSPPYAGEKVLGHVSRFVDELAVWGVSSTGTVMVGTDVAACLAERADQLGDAVLVITAARWPGEPTHWYTTARDLVRSSTRPVLLVPVDLDSRHTRHVRRPAP